MDIILHRPGLTEYAACKSEQAAPCWHAGKKEEGRQKSIAGQPYNLIITELMFEVNNQKIF